ncbi:aspartic proteinase CDR1-like [Phalaenopsis equestris]|uniref:aspartic proteinase CDR1-like n=1 Tax=Phalaenopsis equestris TaxID=78828 RepID=UPI0009E3629B|nr:aspartic proteinase CDR1-like [Phalaenopsis equestris]
MERFSLFFFVACVPFLSPSSAAGFSVDLIHRDSPLSPFYNPSSSPHSLLRASFHRSRRRAAYFLRAASLTPPLHSEIIPNSFEYLMKFSIGTPPTKTLAIVDTGSDLNWVQCTPCKECYAQHLPLFDPSASSSYKPVPCSDMSCSALPQYGDCFSQSNCNYEYSYGDRSYVIGELATETFSFDTADADSHLVHVKNIIFGCTHESNGTFDAMGAGLVGLGGGQLSLITQLGDAVDNKFSYCLPPLNNKSLSGRLNFGAKAVVSGPDAVITDLIFQQTDSYFFLSLEYISVAGDSETIAFKSARNGSQEEGNIIIDSGTTLTLIDDDTLQFLITKLSEVVKLPQVSDPEGMFNLCFDVSETKEVEDGNLPDIIFHFSGADVVLKPLNAFIELDEKTLCLAMISSGGVGGVSIFGNVAQQNFNVGYDLSAMKLTLEPTDCAAV